MTGAVSLPGFGNVRYSMTQVPEYGDGQTYAVIGLMIRYAKEDSESPEVQQAIRESKAWYPNLTPEEQVYRYIRNRVRFIQDEDIARPFQRWYRDYIVETLIRPRDLLRLPVPVAQGDCDDFSMLAASMLLGQGIRASFVTVAADDRDPSQFSHVYVASYRDGGRIPIDSSHGPYAGWEVTGVYRKHEWPVRGAWTWDFDFDANRTSLIVGAVLAAMIIARSR